MTIPFAIVHHANQFLITNGYENRHGLRSTLGTVQDKTGLAWTLELHRRYTVPANVHISGTLIEAIAWHAPTFPRQLREFCLSYDHNLKQLNEEFRLYETQLGIDSERVAPEDVGRFEAVAGELLDQLGYPRGTNQLAPASDVDTKTRIGSFRVELPLEKFQVGRYAVQMIAVNTGGEQAAFGRNCFSLRLAPSAGGVERLQPQASNWVKGCQYRNLAVQEAVRKRKRLSDNFQQGCSAGSARSFLCSCSLTKYEGVLLELSLVWDVLP